MKICVIHIPKTAGSAMHSAFSRIVGSENFLLWDAGGHRFREKLAASSAEFDRFEIISGHLLASDYNMLPGPKTFAAVFREPVARALSWFQFVTSGRAPDHPLLTELRELGLRRALEESEAFRTEIANRQCFLVCGEFSFKGSRLPRSSRSFRR